MEKYEINCCPITNYYKNTMVDPSKKVSKNSISFQSPMPLLKDSIKVNIIMNNEKDPWYLEYLIPQIITLVIGIISFFISQLYMKCLDRKRAEEKYLGNLKVILEEIKHNLDLECQLHAYLYVNILPTFSLSFFIADKIFSELFTVCFNYDLLKQIFYKYFEYKHIQNRIDETCAKAKEVEDIMTGDSTSEKKEVLKSIYESKLLGTLSLIHGDIKNSYKLYNNIVIEITAREKNSLINCLSDDYLKKSMMNFKMNLM